MLPEDRKPPLPDIQDDEPPTDAEREAHEKQRQHHEDRLDEGVEETFPASDPVAVKHIS